MTQNSFNSHGRVSWTQSRVQSPSVVKHFRVCSLGVSIYHWVTVAVQTEQASHRILGNLAGNEHSDSVAQDVSYLAVEGIHTHVHAHTHYHNSSFHKPINTPLRYLTPAAILSYPIKQWVCILISRLFLLGYNVFLKKKTNTQNNMQSLLITNCAKLITASTWKGSKSSNKRQRAARKLKETIHV